MAIDIAESLTSLSQWVFGSTLLHDIFSNAIVISVVISLIMVVLLMFIYPAKANTGVSVLVKLFIYMALSTSLIIFLHDNVVKYNSQNVDVDTTHGGIMGGLNRYDDNITLGSGSYVPVQPLDSSYQKPIEHNPLPIQTYSQVSGGDLDKSISLDKSNSLNISDDLDKSFQLPSTTLGGCAPPSQRRSLFA